MRDCSTNRAGFDRVLMAVAATFLAVSATSALAQSDGPRTSPAELAIDAAVPRPEPANVPPPTASDFKMDITASTPDAANTAAPSTTAKAPDPKPAEIVTAPAAESKPAEASRIETPKSDTATTTPATLAPATATAPAPEPAREPVKAASNVPAADQPVADKLREMLGGKSVRVFDRKGEQIGRAHV